MVVVSTIQPMVVRPKNGMGSDMSITSRMTLAGICLSFKWAMGSGSMLSWATA